MRRCLGILCRAGRDERGAALVEFALVLPLLLTLLLGTIDFGKAFNYWNDQTQLAATGARFAAVNHNPGGGTLQQYIQSQADTTELRNGGTAQVASPVSVCITFPAGTSNPGDPVQVTVTSQYNWLGFVRSRTGIASTTLTGSATMRLEATPTNYGAGCT